MKHDALQCGYCTPGMILTAYAFLRQHPRPSEAEIVSAMDDNLCRCAPTPGSCRPSSRPPGRWRRGVT